jgi:response regulator RpfG family c-di-GMP phosphodiesterase
LKLSLDARELAHLRALAHGAGPAAEPEQPNEALARLERLLVDDDIAVRSALRQMLVEAGLIVAVAENGDSALRVLRGDPSALQIAAFPQACMRGDRRSAASSGAKMSRRLCSKSSLTACAPWALDRPCR